ncbi:MAG: DUF2726 domain-containing protein [Anaerolineae bacterium]|nr:DUF2726 domain-containing protein [Anaerolineae bacterium]
MTTNKGCLELIKSLFGAAEPVAEWPYSMKDSLLSPTEISFYHVLASTVNEQVVICPKVGLKDLLFITKRYKSRDYYKYFGRISQKHVDFVLCEPKSMQPIVAIELDDRSHDKTSRSKRDAVVDQIFSAAGLPLLRIAAAKTYNTSELTAILAPYLQRGKAQSAAPAAAPVDQSSPPNCPRCGIPMVVRTATKGANAGQQFYGCSNYPDCREIVRIE